MAKSQEPDGGRNGGELPKGSGGRNGGELPKGSGRDGELPKGSNRGMLGALRSAGGSSGWVVVAFISPTSLDVPSLALDLVSGQGDDGHASASELANTARARVHLREKEFDDLRKTARAGEKAQQELELMRAQLSAARAEIKTLGGGGVELVRASSRQGAAKRGSVRGKKVR